MFDNTQLVHDLKDCELPNNVKHRMSKKGSTSLIKLTSDD